MNLLMLNLAVDAEHVTLAFGLRWIEALAQRFDRVDVVTMYAGRHHLPPNVTVWSVGRERGYPEWLRALRFYWLIWRILRQRRFAVVFTHMIPVFAVLFWPVAKLAHVKNVLWYAHGATPPILRLAHRLVDKVVSSTPEGFRLSSQKVRFLGQGIDLKLYPYHPRRAAVTIHLVTVSRLAPSKGIDRLLDALADWQAPDKRLWQLTVIGDATNDGERDYADRLRRSAVKHFTARQIVFTGRIAPEMIAPQLAEADIFVNLGTTGSLDKAIVEAMASGCLVISCNDAFRTIAKTEGFSACVIDCDSVAAVRDALSRVMALNDLERQKLADTQAYVARRDHTLDGLIDNLTDVLLETATGRG